MTVELNDLPEPAADMMERLPRGMRIRLACGTIAEAAKDAGVDATEVVEWLTSLAAATDRFDYHRAVAQEAALQEPEPRG